MAGIKDCLFRKFRKLTAPLRVGPDFIIIGDVKCGTTSLYSYLIETPYVYSKVPKTIQFFNRRCRYKLGINFYKAYFPTKIYKYFFKLINGYFCVGEATAHYLFDPHALRRIFENFPKAKIIILLRNPIDRAYSHYWRLRTALRGLEYLSFEEALQVEEKRTKGELGKMVKNENYESASYKSFSYKKRGIYINQIKNVMKFFPKEQVLILKSEDLFENPSDILKTVLTFLKLPNRLQKNKEYKVYQGGQKIKKYVKYPPINLETRKYLFEYFKPFNQELYEYTGRDFGWK